MNDDRRNSRILDDVIASIREGRSPIVLTERREHATLLASHLERHAPKLVVLMGGKGVRERRAAAVRLAALAPDEARVIVATGKFVGEGFDDARLDTLFLTMPISWDGLLVQYVGRLPSPPDRPLERRTTARCKPPRRSDDQRPKAHVSAGKKLAPRTQVPRVARKTRTL